MGDKLLQALDLYEKAFDDSFPTIPMSGRTEEEIIDMINKCVSEKKDVYDMGYLEMEKVYWMGEVMRMYIPESELNNADNMQRIMDILEKVPDTDFQCMDNTEMTLDDAVQAIRELGEDKITDLLCSGGAGSWYGGICHPFATVPPHFTGFYGR